MKLLIQRLASEMQGAPGTVFVVGAGGGAEIPFWRELGSPHLVLAEAHPRQAEELARRISPTRNEEVWPLAIVATPAAHAILQLLNNPLFSSLKPPHELTRHYPNLHVTGQAEVAALSLGESIETLALDATGNHLLVIDAPGQAWDLLSATPARLLQSFLGIIVRCGTTPLYAGDRGRGDIAGLLENAGFDIELDDPEAIYPQASVLLKRNDIRVRITHLEAQLRQREDEYAAKLKAELDKTTRSAAEQQKLTIGLQEEVRKLTAERDAQTTLASQHMDEAAKIAKALAEQQKSAAHQAEKLTGERDARAKLAEQRQGELDASAKSAAEAKASLQSVQNAYSEEKKKVSAKQNEIAQWVQQNRQLQAELAEMRRKQDLLRDQLTRSNAQIDLIKSLMLSEQRG